MRTGSIFCRKADRRWVAQVSEGTGKARVVRRKVGRSYSEAKRLLAALMAEHGVLMSTMTLGEYLASWLVTVRRDVNPSTWETYEIAVRRQIVPALGHVQLGRLTHDHVERMVRGLTMTPKGIRNVLSVLSGALTDADRKGLVTRNVAALVRRPKLDRAEVAALSVADVRAILATVRGDRLEALYVVALASGLRQAEILGLFWSDWQDGALRVQRTLDRVDGRYGFGEPKTRRSRRTVTLPAFANDALTRHHASQLAERLAAGPGTEEGLIFTAPTGRPVNGGWLSHRWATLADRASVDVTFHQLRHGQTSLLVALGVHPRVIAERLGHASATISMDLYAHLAADSDREAARLLQEAIG